MTGVTLARTGEVDDQGFQPLDSLFSSPQAPPAAANGDDDDDDDDEEVEVDVSVRLLGSTMRERWDEMASARQRAVPQH